MKWRKHGIVYRPDGSLPFARSHAMLPTPILLGDTLRVYFTTRDAEGVGRPFYADLDPDNATRVLSVSPTPVLDVGAPGTFDENGVLPCSVVAVGGRLHMYYIGFELGTKIRFRILSGLAISDDGGRTFERVSQTPILDRSDGELFIRSSPLALWEGGRMRLWYVSGNAWTEVDGKALPVTDLRYAESADGVVWPRVGKVCLATDDGAEQGFGRAWAMRRGAGDYQLFLSVRLRSRALYRLGYAESSDGVTWKRMDEALGLGTTPGSFDGTSIMYAAVVHLKGRTYCFYNGDDFGREGFAVAELVSS